MNDEPKDIEILISRHMDGMLDEDQQLELNRRVIRDPQARRLMDEFRQDDALAAEVLDRAIPDRGASVDAAAILAGHPRRPRMGIHRGWWLLPGAIAAALMAGFVHNATLEPQTEQRAVDVTATQPIPTVGPAWNGSSDLTRNVVHPAVPRRRITRELARDVYGIMGRDGRIYLIEVDRTRTIKRPNAASKYRPVSQEL